MTPDGVTLNPLQLQMVAALVSGARFVSVRAGWGSGKTSGLVFSILYRATVYPGEAILLVTDTSARFERVLLPEMRKWLSPLGWHYVAGRNVTGRWVESATNTVVWVVSYIRASTRSQAHNPLEGINAACAFIDECQTLQPEVAVKAFGRIRAGSYPTLMMVGLPVAGAWWLQHTEAMGGVCLYATSHTNSANLGPGWLEEAEKLPEAEREAMIYNRPQPPEGQVYRTWLPEAWPDGNLAPVGWEYSPDMETRLAGDWGVNKPWVGIIAHDPEIGADVLVGELNPREVTLGQLVYLILAIAWPRAFAAQMPKDGRPRFLLDAGSGDKAGRIRNDQTLRSTFDVLESAPPSKRMPHPDGSEKFGIGMRLRSTTSPVRTNVPNGVEKMKARIGDRKLLCTREVWEDGLSSAHKDQMVRLGVRHNGNSFATSLMGYHYPDNGKEDPVKDGREDPMDGMRYDVINWHYHGGARPNPPQARAEPMRAPSLSTGGERTSWRGRRVGR